MKNYDMEIRILPMDKICYVKRIYLENNYFSGVACYTRSLTLDYKNGEPNSAGHDAKGMPQDELDNAILSALKQVYPDAICISNMQICNVDLDFNNNWKAQREVHEIEIWVEEMIEEQLPSYTFPIKHPRRIGRMEVELYCLTGVKFDLHKALQYYLHQCTEEEFNRIYVLEENTYHRMSENN